MANEDRFRYQPDYAIAPGETLVEVLRELGMTQAELATRTGRPLKTINEIVKAKAGITPETALQFEKVLGVTASFWTNLESNYQQFRARSGEKETFKRFVTWLDELPIKDLIKREFLPSTQDKSELVSHALAFFGVSDPDVWREIWLNPKAAFHRSHAFRVSPGAMAAWLRIGELKSQKIRTRPFDKRGFQESLTTIRTLTTAPPRQVKRDLVDLCSRWGVAVVFVAELPGTHVSGATQWLSTDKALIQLSCRYKSDDQFWHAFFHESGHILLHGKRAAFIDEKVGATPDELEKQANEFACSTLVPPAAMRQFLRHWRGDEAGLIDFATQLEIAPGIVVGQLQHMKEIEYNQFTQLKRYQFDLTD